MCSIRADVMPSQTTPIDDLPLTPRARRWLKAGGVHTVAHLLQRTEQDLLTLGNFSHTSLAHVKRFLGRHNLSLQPDRPHDCDGSMVRAALANRAVKLNARERKVLSLRHGIADDSPRTLAEIGKKLKLTRERVRQIQKLAEQKAIVHHLHSNSGDPGASIGA